MKLTKLQQSSTQIVSQDSLEAQKYTSATKFSLNFIPDSDSPLPTKLIRTKARVLENVKVEIGR